MSSQSYSTFQSSSFSSYSDSNGNTYQESSYSNPDGTTTERLTKEAGKPAISEKTSSAAKDQRHVEDGASSQNRIEDLGDVDESAAARQYEERIEDEYAKREGGA